MCWAYTGRRWRRIEAGDGRYGWWVSVLEPEPSGTEETPESTHFSVAAQPSPSVHFYCLSLWSTGCVSAVCRLCSQSPPLPPNSAPYWFLFAAPPHQSQTTWCSTQPPLSHLIVALHVNKCLPLNVNIWCRLHVSSICTFHECINYVFYKKFKSVKKWVFVIFKVGNSSQFPTAWEVGCTPFFFFSLSFSF